MEEARALIVAFRELNETNDRKIGLFTSSLISLFGSTSMFNDFLGEIDTAIVSNTISSDVKMRAANLAQTYIPQVAGLNSIKDLDDAQVSAEILLGISNDSAEHRHEGTRVILAALKRILQAVNNIN